MKFIKPSGSLGWKFTRTLEEAIAFQAELVFEDFLIEGREIEASEAESAEADEEATMAEGDQD